MAEYQVMMIALAGGVRHEHITHLYCGGRWWPRWEVVRAIGYGDAFYTQVAYGSRTYLKVVNATPPYVQTYANNTATDNLLSLPKAA